MHPLAPRGLSASGSAENTFSNFRSVKCAFAWIGWNEQTKGFFAGPRSKWANKLCHKDQKVQTNCGGKVTNFTISEAVKEFQDFLNLQKFVKVMNGQWLSVLNRAKLEREFWRLKQAGGKKNYQCIIRQLIKKKSDTLSVWCLFFGLTAPQKRNIIMLFPIIQNCNIIWRLGISQIYGTDGKPLTAKEMCIIHCTGNENTKVGWERKNSSAEKS